MSPTQTPSTCAGWSDSIETAEAADLTAWHMARMAGAGYGQLGEVRRPNAAPPRWLEPSPKSLRSRCRAASRPKMDTVACTISSKKNRGDNSREGNRGNGSGRGNGRDEAGGA